MWIIVITLPAPDNQPMYVGPFPDQGDAQDYANAQLSAYDPHVTVVSMAPVPDLIHG